MVIVGQVRKCFMRVMVLLLLLIVVSVVVTEDGMDIEGLLKHSCDDYGWIEGRCTGSCRLNARLVHSEVID